MKKNIAKNLTEKMKAHFPEKIMGLLGLIGEMSNKAGYRSYLVGGVVRDLLLGTENLDLDIVVEGDAPAVGRVLAEHLEGHIVVYRRYRTCTVKTAHGLKVDLVTARKEFYKHPAALPKVEPATLKDDLGRRDFTINAMAISLNHDDFGTLIDFFGGVDDLKRRRIDILHDLSFYDDPTRIFRAIRFEQRLGFKISAHTERLIRDAVRKKMIHRLESRRVRNEMMLIFKEKKTSHMSKRLKGMI